MSTTIATLASERTGKLAVPTHVPRVPCPPPKAGNMHEPIPAAYGSYSNWAGSSNSYQWNFSKQQPSASFASGTKKSTTDTQQPQGDPGAYRPVSYTHLTLPTILLV